MPDLDRLDGRYKRGMTVLGPALSYFQELAELFRPSNILNKTPGQEGRNKTVRLYHSGGIKAADKLARTIHGTVTSPAAKWYSQKMRQKWLNDQQAIRTWLEETADEMYLADNQSNFASAIGSFWGDGVVFGNAGLMTDEGPIPDHGGFGGFQFQNLALGSYCIERNARGVVDVLFRQLDYPVRDLPTLFPMADLGQELAELGREKPETLIRCIHATYPRAEHDPGKRGVKNMKWASVYWTERYGKRLLEESGYPEFPFVHWAWSLAAGETYGFGQGHLALPDVKTLNKNRQLRLEAAGQDALPPSLEKPGILGTLSLAPGARNKVSEDVQDLDGVYRQLYSGSKHDVAALTDKEIEAAVAEMFYNAEIQLRDRPNMTATEVQAVVEQGQRLLGPTLGRIHADVLVPMHARKFGLMMRAGALPPPPQELLDALQMNPGQVDIDVQFEGPLARAQRAGDIIAIDRANAYRLGVVNLQLAAGLEPNILDGVNFDEQEREYAEVVGEPANIHRDAKEIAQARQVRAQLKAQQQQLNQASQVAEAAGKAAPALTAIHQASQPVGAA